MQKSLLLKVVKSLKKAERKGFGTLLASAFFNKGSKAAEVCKLWELIDKGLKRSKEDYWAKERIYALLYPGQPIYKGKLEKLMSQMLQLLHQYVVFNSQHSAPESSQYQLVLFQFYMERGLSAEANLRARNLAKNQAALPTTAENLHQEFLLNKYISRFDSLSSSRSENLNLPTLLESLDQFYLLARLEYSIQLLAINQWITPIDLAEIVSRLDHYLNSVPPKLQADPVFSLYLQVYHLIKNFEQSEAELYKKFIKELAAKEAYCTADQLKAFQTLARNYCIYFYHQGELEFMKLGYELYREQLKRGLLYHQDKMLVGTFRNLVLLGIWNKEEEWVEQFIDSHQEKITGSDDVEVIYNLHKATLAFYQGKYDEAMDLLPNNYEDQYLKLAARRLEIMIFCQQESPVFMSKLEAFKIYIYRFAEDVNLQITKDRNRNFSDILKQVQHPKTLGNTTRIDKLRKKIQETNYVAERPWLLDKLNAMSG